MVLTKVEKNNITNVKKNIENLEIFKKKIESILIQNVLYIHTHTHILMQMLYNAISINYSKIFIF